MHSKKIYTWNIYGTIELAMFSFLTFTSPTMPFQQIENVHPELLLNSSWFLRTNSTMRTRPHFTFSNRFNFKCCLILNMRYSLFCKADRITTSLTRTSLRNAPTSFFGLLFFESILNTHCFSFFLGALAFILESRVLHSRDYYFIK